MELGSACAPAPDLRARRREAAVADGDDGTGGAELRAGVVGDAYGPAVRRRAARDGDVAAE
jgi:hypothetical protein